MHTCKQTSMMQHRIAIVLAMSECNADLVFVHVLLLACLTSRQHTAQRRLRK